MTKRTTFPSFEYCYCMFLIIYLFFCYLSRIPIELRKKSRKRRSYWEFQSSYILRRLHIFSKPSPCVWLQYIQSKVRERFRKILRPSQNIWTLKLSFRTHLSYKSIITCSRHVCTNSKIHEFQCISKIVFLVKKLQCLFWEKKQF